MLTGKNGSGKTSVLDAVSRYLDMICRDKNYFSYLHNLQINKDSLEKLTKLRASQENIDQAKTNIQNCEDAINEKRQGLEISFNCSEKLLQDRFEAGEFILAYFRDNRIFEATIPKHVEKVPIKESYELNIRDDKSFEVIKDGVESVVDIDCETQLQCSRFRNIQDSLCGLDRNQYVWTKMGMAMTQGALPIMQQAKTEQSVNNGEQNLEKDF